MNIDEYFQAFYDLITEAKTVSHLWAVSHFCLDWPETMSSGESRSQEKGVAMPNLILHIPHASLRIPEYSHYLLPPEAVDAEAWHLTDLYTDVSMIRGLH